MTLGDSPPSTLRPLSIEVLLPSSPASWRCVFFVDSNRFYPTTIGTPAKNNEVYGNVDDKHEPAQPPLKLAREKGRVKNRNEVVLDERGRVGRSTAVLAKPVLKGCERAGQACELDERPPTYRREMYPSSPRPARDEHATEKHEQNEGDMKGYGSVGENAKDHNR